MTDDLDSPTVRALLVLDLLQRHTRLTADELARNLGVSARAARRYVATLRNADIAVESVPRRYGGYRLGGGLRLPPLVFASSEALALVMAVLDGQHSAAADDPVGVALGKIIRALPRDVSRQAALLREHALAAPDRRAGRPDPAITSLLVEAVADRHRIRLTYPPPVRFEPDPGCRPLGRGRSTRPLVPPVPGPRHRRSAQLPNRPHQRPEGSPRILRAT